MLSYQFVDAEIDGHRGEIRLNRPQSLNALNGPMLKELSRALTDMAEDQSVRVVILSGNGRGFCSGQDLKEVAAQGPDVDIGEHLNSYYHPVIYALRQMAKPCIAKIHGIAAGAGMSLALACDLRIGSEDAQFSQAFVKIGLIPDSGSTYFLPRLIGLGKAMELAMLGDVISAKEAYTLGLLNQVVPPKDLDDATSQLVQRLGALPPRALALIKRALHESSEHNLTQQLHLEQDLQQEAALTEDYHIGLDAFIHKRTPHFTGR